MLNSGSYFVFVTLSLDNDHKKPNEYYGIKPFNGLVNVIIYNSIPVNSLVYSF